MGKLDEAQALLERALHLDPSNKIVQQDLARMQANRKKDVQKEKSLYKKMFGLKTSTNASAAASTEKPKVALAVSLPIFVPGYLSQ